MARLNATPRLVRSIEERMMIPRSSVSWTVSSLHEYQSTPRSRFSFVTESRFTPSSRSSAMTVSGDSDEVTTNPLPPDLRPSARNMSAKRSFSWPGGPWRTTLEPTGSPPWTSASNPGTRGGSPGMKSPLERTSQAASECEVRMGGDRVAERRLKDSLRRFRPEPLRAYVPEVAMDRRDEFPESVQARLGPVHHLIEDRFPELLVVRREPMLHLDLDRRRADEPDSLEERMEVGDVEVDHLAKGPGLVLEIHLEAQVRGPQSVLERAGIVRPTVDEPEIRESLKELRRGRDVHVKRARDLARKVPVPVAERSEDRDAVLAREKENRLSERLLVHVGKPRNQSHSGGRSLFIVELGALKACPGILTLDYLGEERTNSGLYGGRPPGKFTQSESLARGREFHRPLREG